MSARDEPLETVLNAFEDDELILAGNYSVRVQGGSLVLTIPEVVRKNLDIQPDSSFDVYFDKNGRLLADHNPATEGDSG